MFDFANERRVEPGALSGNDEIMIDESEPAVAVD
jgi:hypothetical protein